MKGNDNMIKPPIEVSATFQGGLRGDVSGSIALDAEVVKPTEPPSVPPPDHPGWLYHVGNPYLWRIAEAIVKAIVGLFIRHRLPAPAKCGVEFR